MHCYINCRRHKLLDLEKVQRFIEKRLSVPTLSDVIDAFSLVTASVWDYIGDLANSRLREGKFEFRSTDNVAIIIKNFYEGLQHCISNEDYLFDSEHMQNEIIDLSIEKEDAAAALNELKTSYYNCKIAEEKEQIQQVFVSYLRAINALLRSVRRICEKRGREDLLKNKDLSEIDMIL